MPKVTIVRSFPDEDQLHVSIEVEEDHPDGLLSEAARVCVETFAVAHGIMMTAIEDEPDGR
jgi:hypothetical protein